MPPKSRQMAGTRLPKLGDNFLSMTDYLKFYSRYYGITWDRQKFEVHHIDGNRKNNEIENLVLLPVELHRELHKAMSALWVPEMPAKVAVFQYLQTCLNGWSDWFIGKALPDLIEVVNKCHKWALLKQVNYCDCDGVKIQKIK